MSRSPFKTRVPVNLAQKASDLARQTSLWEPLVAYDPLSRYYVRLAKQPDYEAWLLTWLPGQGTDWHDHGRSAGAFQVLRGALTEDRARFLSEGNALVEPRSSQLGRGSLRTFGRRYLHRVVNNGLEPAVSVHVYSPALVEMNQYVDRGGRLHLAASQAVGVDW